MTVAKTGTFGNFVNRQFGIPEQQAGFINALMRQETLRGQPGLLFEQTRIGGLE